MLAWYISILTLLVDPPDSFALWRSLSTITQSSNLIVLNLALSLSKVFDATFDSLDLFFHKLSFSPEVASELRICCDNSTSLNLADLTLMPRNEDVTWRSIDALLVGFYLSGSQTGLIRAPYFESVFIMATPLSKITFVESRGLALLVSSQWVPTSIDKMLLFVSYEWCSRMTFMKPAKETLIICSAISAVT